MTTATDSIRSHQAAFRSLAGIPVPAPLRYTVGPCAAGGYEVADSTESDPGKARRSLCASDADAQHHADELNWDERRAAIEAAAERQGEDVDCETDR